MHFRNFLSGLAGSLALTFASAAVAQSPLVNSGFEVGTESRTFDGATFDVVRLESPIVTLSAYSFGSWTPVSSGVRQPGLVLRHRAITGVSFVVAPVEMARNPVAPDQWNEYVANVHKSFGSTATLGPKADSNVDNMVVEILGWTTREATFVVAQPDGREPYVEQHVVASGEESGVVFVLGGTQSQVEAARRDFRFFLARLESRPNADRVSANRRLAANSPAR
jgi:hypothetical protein